MVSYVNKCAYMITTQSAEAVISDPTASDICEVEYIDKAKVTTVAAAMKSTAAIHLLADTFRALGDPTRIRIAFALSLEELCVCDLANLLKVSQSAVSHSLRVLRQMKLVTYRKQGKIAYYSLDDDHIGRLLAEGFTHVEELI